MKSKTPKRAAADQPSPAVKSAPVRRSRARKSVEPMSTADDRSTVLPDAPIEATAAPAALTATIGEQIASVVADTGATPADQIARRAYELYQQDGEVHGRDMEHWLAAERELTERSR